MNMGMERWGFLFSVVSSPIVYFLKTTHAVCPNINPIMLCTHVCDVNYAACYWTTADTESCVLIALKLQFLGRKNYGRLRVFLLFMNDFKNCTSSLDLHLFADDSNLFFSHKNLAQLEMIINVELAHVQTWLSTNKLSLNIDKSNYVLFHPPQKKVNISIKLNINDTSLKEKPCIKYLGIMLDSNLNWKSHVNYISTKIKRNIGILSKMRYLVILDILISPYYTLIYPFLIYGLVVWGNTYPTNIKPLFILQKRTIRIITFSKFDEHSSQLFKLANILNLF